MTVQDALSQPCPVCGSTGPHTEAVDHPDPQFAHLIPVVCGNSECGVEFVVDTAS